VKIWAWQQARWILAAALAVPACRQDNSNPQPDPSGTPVASGPNEWPMYGHDPARTSHNPAETALNAAAVPRLAARWQSFVDIGPLPPSCSPAVAGGRVFACSSRTDGDNFFAFDAATGRPLWTADLGRPGSGTVGIGASPAVSGSVVVAGGADGAYYGLDAATGAILWRHDLEERNGFAWASPLVANGRVYVGVSSEGEPPGSGAVRALDLATGALLASQGIVPDGVLGGDIWNSPALTPDGQTLVIATGNDFGGYDGPYTRAIVALDPMTLTIKEARQEAAPGLDLDFGTTPVVFRDRQGRTLTAAHNKNGTLYAYELGRLVAGAIWKRQNGLAVGLMPAFDSTLGTLFYAGDNGQLFGVDPASGADRWPSVAVGFMNGNLALANGLLFASSGGRVFVLDAASGRVLRSLSPDNPGRSFSGVVVAGGAVYWMSGGYLNAWGLP